MASSSGKAPSSRGKCRFDGMKNIVGKSLAREIPNPFSATRKSGISFVDEKFRNFSLTASLDPHDPDHMSTLRHTYMKRRTKISQIIAADGLVFSLSQAGICSVLGRHSMSHICFLNADSDEIIRSLFHNKFNNSIITIFVKRCEMFGTLRCRCFPIEYLKRRRTDGSFPLFESECLKYPGYVEFDEINGTALTYSAVDKKHKIWDLCNYDFKFALPFENIEEVKFGRGVLLLHFSRQNQTSSIFLKIMDISNGKCVKDLSRLIKRGKQIDFIELFNETLLIKQANENLQIVDVRTSEVTDIDNTDILTPQGFFFLQEKQLFLTFRNKSIAVWNGHGEVVNRFEDHSARYCGTTAPNIVVSQSQDLVISHTRKGESDFDEAFLTVSHITGKTVARIRGVRGSESECALDHVSALYFDEDTNEIYTGNSGGTISIWGN